MINKLQGNLKMINMSVSEPMFVHSLLFSFSSIFLGLVLELHITQRQLESP